MVRFNDDADANKSSDLLTSHFTKHHSAHVRTLENL
jgi:hypothetical protein